MAISHQTVGNIGLFYVCYRLSRLGWNVLPTSRNARGIDIVAYSNDGKTTRTFQVKSLSKRNAVSLGKDPSHLTADFLIVCRYVQRDDPPPECFILAPDEVARLRVSSGKDSNVTYWLNAPQYEAPDFRDDWERIGLATGGVIPTDSE